MKLGGLGGISEPRMVFAINSKRSYAFMLDEQAFGFQLRISLRSGRVMIHWRNLDYKRKNQPERSDQLN